MCRIYFHITPNVLLWSQCNIFNVLFFFFDILLDLYLNAFMSFNGKYFIEEGNFQNMNLILFGVPDFIVIYYLLVWNIISKWIYLSVYEAKDKIDLKLHWFGRIYIPHTFCFASPPASWEFCDSFIDVSNIGWGSHIQNKFNFW